MRICGVSGMRGGTVRTVLAGAVSLGLLTACAGGGGADGTGGGEGASRTPSRGAEARKADATRIPGVGDRLQTEIPDRTRQVVAVYGEGRDAAEARVELYTREGGTWSRERSWSGHNGKRGWTTGHREGDKRSPVGVFSLSDAGGVLPDPGTELPYTHSAAFTPPSHWPERTRHDFDYVLAVDYNRVPGTSPLDPTRPEGQEKGGFIWLHRDHGSGTSGCVSVSKAAMEYLLRTLDPDRHPVVVMGDRATLRR